MTTETKLTGRGGKHNPGRPTNKKRGVPDKLTNVIAVRVLESTKDWYDTLPLEQKRPLLEQMRQVVEKACTDAHIL